MNGIPFSSYFTFIFMSIMLLYILVEMLLLPFFVQRDEKETDSSEKEQVKNKSKLKDTIQIVVMLLTIYVSIFLVLKYQFKPVFYPLMVLGMLMFAIISLFAILSFIRYIFLKPYDYELTKDREDSLFLVGIVAWIFLSVIAQENTINQINWLMCNAQPILMDFSIMAILTFWYFFVIFYILSFLILSLQKINSIIRSRINLNPKKINSKPNSEVSEQKLLSNQIIAKIETLSNKEWGKKICYNVIWFICLPLDAIIGFLKAMAKLTKDMLKIIFLLIPKMIAEAIRYFSDVLNGNLGKAIIVISRISIVSSLLLVYLLDRYNQIFSSSGSETYGFLCSVIIIPLFIAQLIRAC